MDKISMMPSCFPLTIQRSVGWFSAGAASAVACLLYKPDIIAYCETGSEDTDNERFLMDCERHFDWNVRRLRSEKYRTTWDVWEGRQYIAGIEGAPCTMELKVKPRLAMQRDDDIHVFGYTFDKRDMIRADALREHWPDLDIRTPLIDMKLTKNSCRHMLKSLGLKEPRVYALGFPNANCIPCPKATSPSYYAMVRKYFPTEFHRLAKLCRKLNVRLTRIKGVRIFIDEIPLDWPTRNPDVPACDFLCGQAELMLIDDQRG